MYLDEGQHDNKLHQATTQVDQTSQIRKISMRINNGSYIYGLRFLDANDRILMELDQGDDLSEWVTQTLGPGESIIGVYGRRKGNRGCVFNCLGFVVWDK